MQHARIEPTFGPLKNETTAKQPSTKPGEIRTISVAEYKKQIEAAKKGQVNPQDLQDQEEETEEADIRKGVVWRKFGNGMLWAVFICLNIGLVYFEMQPKTLKPTFYIGTPWGTAEILTPWGKEEEPKKVAQLSVRKAQVPMQASSFIVEKDGNTRAANESNEGSENVGYYDK
jgi:hypothetical protein